MTPSLPWNGGSSPQSPETGAEQAEAGGDGSGGDADSDPEPPNSQPDCTQDAPASTDGATPSPILLLDVDGVLLPFGGPVPRVIDYGRTPPAAMRERVARLTAVFEPWWCTGWEDAAPGAFAEPLALVAPWPVVSMRNASLRPRGHWKRIPLDSFIAANPGRRMAWVDDEFDGDDVAWASQHPELLLWKTDPTIGLSDQDVDALLGWAVRSAS